MDLLEHQPSTSHRPFSILTLRSLPVFCSVRAKRDKRDKRRRHLKQREKKPGSRTGTAYAQVAWLSALRCLSSHTHSWYRRVSLLCTGHIFVPFFSFCFSTSSDNRATPFGAGPMLRSIVIGFLPAPQSFSNPSHLCLLLYFVHSSLHLAAVSLFLFFLFFSSPSSSSLQHSYCHIILQSPVLLLLRHPPPSSFIPPACHLPRAVFNLAPGFLEENITQPASGP